MFVMRRALLRGIATTVLGGVPLTGMTRELNAAAATGACLCAGEVLGHYGFPDGHPLGADRQGAFLKEAEQRGLHHAGRAHSAGFCVFNDLGVVIETLRQQYGIGRIAYVDIDVHHGDGIFYVYEADPDLIFADVHEDGRSHT